MSSRKPLEPENQNHQDDEDSSSLSSLYAYLFSLILFITFFALEKISCISLTMKEEQLHLLQDFISGRPVKQEIVHRPYRT